MRLEILMLAQMRQIDFSAHKGLPRIKASTPDGIWLRFSSRAHSALLSICVGRPGRGLNRQSGKKSGWC